MSSEAQIKSEIERLTATINQHKASQQKQPSWKHPTHYSPYGGYARNNKYVNPSYAPSHKYVRPGLDTSGVSLPSTSATGSTSAASPTVMSPVVAQSTSLAAPVSASTSRPPPVVPGQVKEVVLGGVAFESSGRSLVRKDLPKSVKPVVVPKPAPTSTSRPPASHHFGRKPGHVPPGRGFRSKALRGRNMTLNNSRKGPYQRKGAPKRKFIEKPCARFTTTGACTRGLTCPYQHDPSKIAICWDFLQDKCTKTAETCSLSHDPTPERTPLCVHFLNKGRCTREKCHFPHVNVGQRQGVCRDFAVLGYCERGLECDHQHVRECPDFAERGTCETKGCKLPHVIRANRSRKPGTTTSSKEVERMDVLPANSGSSGEAIPMVTAEDGQLGDEFISLTFKESDSEEESDDEDENEEDDEGGSEEESGENDEPDVDM